MQPQAVNAGGTRKTRSATSGFASVPADRVGYAYAECISGLDLAWTVR